MREVRKTEASADGSVRALAPSRRPHQVEPDAELGQPGSVRPVEDGFGLLVAESPVTRRDGPTDGLQHTIDVKKEQRSLGCSPRRGHGRTLRRRLAAGCLGQTELHERIRQGWVFPHVHGAGGEEKPPTRR